MPLSGCGELIFWKKLTCVDSRVSLLRVEIENETFQGNFWESRMRVIVLGGNQSLRMGMRVLTCQMLRNMQTFLVSDIPLLVAGEEFMVREKPIREKFIIWWKYIYPWCAPQFVIETMAIFTSFTSGNVDDFKIHTLKGTHVRTRGQFDRKFCSEIID